MHEPTRNSTAAAARLALAYSLIGLGISVQGAEAGADVKPGAADASVFNALDREYRERVRPMFDQYCGKCHSTDVAEADVDLEKFRSMAEVRRGSATWQKVAVALSKGEMPPPEARQPKPAEIQALRDWVGQYLTFEAQARAGDPGRVLLRRLNNAEYTNTIRDLTGIGSLDPAREFPVDGAAGEGFTNTGNALVMSPALVTKYLDAAKQIAEHAVLTPEGMHFSTHTTPRDWTNDAIAEIRQLYSQFTNSGEGDKVNRDGIVLDTNKGGRLPLERYLRATLEERESLANGRKTAEQVARQRGLNAKYLDRLWQMLSSGRVDYEDAGARRPSLLLESIRARWKAAKASDAPALTAEIAQWQQALWRFTSVGHIGKVNGPKAWLEPVSPLTSREDFRVKVPTSADAKEVTLYLASTSVAERRDDASYVIWERPRLVMPGRPDLLLRDVRPMVAELTKRRDHLFAVTANCLSAAAEATASSGPVDVPTLAKKHGVDAESLSPWLDYLGIAADGMVKLGTPLDRKLLGTPEYSFIKGWIGDDALSVLANSSDQGVRIPGNIRPHSIAVHPSPALSVAVGWRSPVASKVRIKAAVQHAHPECGNGVVWSLEVRRGNTRERLATGKSERAKVISIGPFEKVSVRTGDVVSLVINPRESNHACDLTQIDLNVNDGTHEWDMARDLSSDILAGNPHKDGHGHADVWNCYSEPASGATGYVIPSGSVLAQWRDATSAAERAKLAESLKQLLVGGPAPKKGSADALLREQLTSLNGPLMTAVLRAITLKPGQAVDSGKSDWNLDPALFGKHPNGSAIDPASLCVKAPSVIEIKLPPTSRQVQSSRRWELCTERRDETRPCNFRSGRPSRVSPRCCDPRRPKRRRAGPGRQRTE